MNEKFSKDPEELRNKQTEMNNTLEETDSRITDSRISKQWISDLEDKMVEITAAEQNTEKINKVKTV